MNKTSPCLRNEELTQLLDDSLPGERQERCTEHLESCTTCQTKLEQIATDGTNLSQVVERLSEADPLATSAYWPALKSLESDRQLAASLVATKQAAAPARGPATGSDTETALTFLQPATDAAYLGRIAHFDIMRVIGRGGMGVVLEAFDTKLQRNVAIKILGPELASEEINRQRFCREARAAASVTHENVVAVHQVENACEKGLPYLVMQLITGETLEQRLNREKKLPVKEIVRIGMQAARGLAAAHAQGLIHRDIKPANILLEPPHDRVKLTDFGLARLAEDVKLTRTGFVTGTPLYMAPEQAMGETVDQRSDLFSLGAVLYEMTSGQTPFTGLSALMILKQITEAKHKPLRELEPDTPEWLAELIDELLAKKPADRYQTASDLAEVLEYHWAHLKTSTNDLPGVCQVELNRRRLRNRILFAAVTSAVLVAGVLLGMFLPHRSSEQPGQTGAATVVVSSAEPVAVLVANAGSVWSVSFDSNSQTVAMGIEDGTVRLWDLPTKSVKSTINAHRGVVWASKFSADGQTLVTAGDDGLLKVWKPLDNEPLHVFDHPNAVRGLAISSDGKLIFAGDRKGGLQVWSAESGASVVKGEHPGAVYAVALSPDGETLATAGSVNVVRLWNAKTLAPKLTLPGHAGPVNSLSFGKDGKVLASAGWDKTVRVWDVGAGLLLRSWNGQSEDLWAIAYSPSGDQLATAGQDGAVRLWDAETGRLLATYLGHKSAVHTIAFNQAGAYLVSGGRDGAARIWPVK